MTAEYFIMVIAPLTALIPLGLIYRAERRLGKYTKRAVVFIIVWVASTYMVANTGFLNDFSSMPPKFVLIFPFIFLFSAIVVRSQLGDLIIRQVSVYTLIGLQGFRVLPEYFLSLAYHEGLAPIQMTWYGRNWDIIAAIVAILLFMLQKYVLISVRTVGILYSALGLGLLLNIFAVAMLSMPTPFRYFMNEPANTFITEAPYIWLPAIWVFIAVFLHFLLLKKLNHLKTIRS